MTSTSSLLLTNIKGIWLPVSSSVQPIKGLKMSQSNLLENAFIWIENGKIASLGLMADLETAVPDAVKNSDSIDCAGRYVLPSWVDAHTHLVFAAWRENEMEMRNAVRPIWKLLPVVVES